MEYFKLRKDEDFIQLNDLIKVLNWVGSGGEAKQVILSEQVTVNDSPELRIRRKLRSGDRVLYEKNSALIE